MTRWLSALSHVTPYSPTSRGGEGGWRKRQREAKRERKREGERGWKNERERETVGQWGELKDGRHKTEAQGPHLLPPRWQAVFPQKDLNRFFPSDALCWVCGARPHKYNTAKPGHTHTLLCVRMQPVYSTTKWCSNLLPSFLMCAMLLFEYESLQQGEMFPNVSIQSSSSLSSTHTLSLLAPS